MNHSTIIPPIMRAFLLLFLLFINSHLLFAHGGEDHAEKETKPTSGHTYFTVTNASDVFECVLRYKPLEAGKQAQMQLFLSDFITNKAIDSAKIEITSPDNDKLKFTIKQTDKGTYSIIGTFPENKSYSLIANISIGDIADLMTLQGIEVGKKLSQPEEAPVESSSFFSWQMLLVFLGGMITCFILLWLVFRRKKVTIHN